MALILLRTFLWGKGRGGGIHVVWGGDIPPLYVEGEYMYIYMPINI